MLYNLLGKKIQNIAEHAGGSKTKKNKVRKTQKNTGKKTIINRKHKGGRLRNVSGSTKQIQIKPSVPIIKSASMGNEGIEELELPMTLTTTNKNNEGIAVSYVNNQANTNTKAKLNFDKIGYMNYENFALFKPDVVKRYRTVNLEGSFVNDMTDLY